MINIWIIFGLLLFAISCRDIAGSVRSQPELLEVFWAEY